MNARDRAAVRWLLRGEPDLLHELARDCGWYDEQDRLQRLEVEQLAEHDANEPHPVPCIHYGRTDWIDERTCGCGEVVL